MVVVQLDVGTYALQPTFSADMMAQRCSQAPRESSHDCALTRVAVRAEKRKRDLKSMLEVVLNCVELGRCFPLASSSSFYTADG